MELIETGMKLFSLKGYHKTSIQEIATAAGISKGAFYLYFESKEEFILTALKYSHSQITKKIADTSGKNYPARENLAKQINLVTNYLYKHRDFIIMHFREDISIGDHAVKLFQQIKIDTYHWLKENIQSIYGTKVDHYLFDIIIQLEGLLNGYFQWIVIEQVEIERERIGPYIVQRLDDIVQGILLEKENPLIPKTNLPTHYQSIINEKKIEEDLRNILGTIKNKISSIDTEKEERERLYKVVDIVSQKVMKKERQNIMIQGLLAHFTSIPELKNECKKVADLLQIELLD